MTNPHELDGASIASTAFSAASECSNQSIASGEVGPSIALLTPYTGGNFGDAAIQDSTIANLRARLPGAEFVGISLDNQNYLRQHGSRAFPLCASSRPFYGMSSPESNEQGRAEPERSTLTRKVKRALHRVPGISQLVRRVKLRLRPIWNELSHCARGYRFLRDCDMLIICGGGQLDEEWGGPWGHPYSLFKWTVLARLARIPCAVASVGACKLESKLSRFFISRTLRFARYRSYRDEGSKTIASGLYASAANDAVVPDLAFSLQDASTSPLAEIETKAQGRVKVAISPIAFGKRGFWPSTDHAIYDRYLDQLAGVISLLLKDGYFLILVWSTTGDEQILPELVARLDEGTKSRLATQACSPALTGWRSLLQVLRSVDFLIASRLHSTILGFVAQLPVVAISFDSKVDRVMRDLQQTRSLLQIQTFTSLDVLRAFSDLEERSQQVREEISAYRQTAQIRCGRQYDAIAALSMTRMARN
jgi:polysaccharide pyruvyl transferase WcaK-like protein